jgi:hypothetical protein
LLVVGAAISFVGLRESPTTPAPVPASETTESTEPPASMATV